MALTHLTDQEYKVVRLVLESQPVAVDELVRLCGVRLDMEGELAWNLFAGLMERGVLLMTDGRVTVQEVSEEIQERVLEQAAEDDDIAGPALDSVHARIFQQKEETPEKEPATVEEAPPEAPEAKAPKQAPAPKRQRIPARKTGETDDPDRHGAGPRWRGPVLVAVAVLLLLAAAIIPLRLFATQDYPKAIRLSGRKLILKDPPADKAQSKAEEWLLEYAKGKTDAGDPGFQSLTVSDMETYEIEQGWPQVIPYDQSGKAGADLAAGFEGKVVFLTTEVRQSGSSDKIAYQYRLYLAGGEEDGYTVSAYAGCQAELFEPYDSETFQADGRTYTLSLCGEETGYGHRLRMAVLSHRDERTILYLTEESSTVYAERHHLHDLNGDGVPDIILDTQYATQLCYLYDQNIAGYTLFSPLSGGQILYSDALPGAVLFTDLAGERTPSYLYQWSDGRSLTELARMELSPAGGGARVCDYYLDGQSVRQHVEDAGKDALNGDLNQNQYTLFNQYMTYAYWDELMLQAAGEHGCLSLPETVTPPEEEWAPFQLRHSDPERDLSIYVSPSGLLLVRREGRFQVIPCAFTDLSRSPAAFDLSGSGEIELLLPFSSLSPALILARWTGGDWALTGLDLTPVKEDFDGHTEYEQAGDALVVRHNGHYGRSEATWAGAPSLTEDTVLTLNLGDYAMTFQNGGTALSLKFPVRVENMDGSVVEGPLHYTVDIRVPLRGMPEIVSGRLS